MPKHQNIMALSTDPWQMAMDNQRQPKQQQKSHYDNTSSLCLGGSYGIINKWIICSAER